MNLPQTILDKIRSLSDDDQRRLLELINTLPSVASGSAWRDIEANSHRTTPIWQRLAKLGEDAARTATDLPADLAANHDFYLHGFPKRP